MSDKKVYTSQIEAQKNKIVTYMPKPVKIKIETYCNMRNQSKSEFVLDAVREKMKALNML